MKGTPSKVRHAAARRAQGRCEAHYPNASGDTVYRCRNAVDTIHHALMRSHGGRILDAAALDAIEQGTFNPAVHIDHLLALCRPCHDEAHMNPARAYQLRHLIRGAVLTGFDGRPVYRGPDVRLSEFWKETSDAS